MVDVSVTSIATPNVFDFIELYGYIWSENSRQIVVATVGSWVDLPLNEARITRNGETGRYKVTNYAIRKVVRMAS